MARKNDIAVLVKKTDFDEKLKNLNKNVTSNKTKHMLVENEINKLYTVYGIGFDSRSEFSLPDNSMGKMSLFLELI